MGSLGGAGNLGPARPADSPGQCGAAFVSDNGQDGRRLFRRTPGPLSKERRTQQRLNKYKITDHEKQKRLPAEQDG